MRSALFRPLFFMALVLLAVGCVTKDQPVVEGIGTVVLFFTEPTLSVQQIDSDRISAVEWNVTKACLNLTVEDQMLDMAVVQDGDPCNSGIENPAVNGEACLWADSAFSATPFNNSRACASGRVFPTELPIQPATLDLELLVKVYRVEPLILDPMADFDGDTILNEDDNCPLVENENQADSGGEGIGDACQVSDTGTPIRDDDLDGVRNGIDNCAWTANPGQVSILSELLRFNTAAAQVPADDPMNLGGCTVQVADVPIVLQLTEAQFRVSSLDVTNLVVDLNLENALENCTWVELDAAGAAGTGSCTYTGTPKLCVRRGLFSSLNGCP